MNTSRRDRLRFAAAGLLILSAVIICVSGIVPPTAYDPSTQLYRHAKQPIQTELLLYEHRHACWALSGICFAASAALALIARGKKRRIANTNLESVCSEST